ncbi:hypothetical protein H4R34_002795, partial [Dimargaris verticillata]
RSIKEIGLVTGPPTLQNVAGFTNPQGNNRTMGYSPDGKYFAWATPTTVCILDVDSNAVIQEIDRPNVVEMYFSPRGTYLLTWERFTKQADSTEPHLNTNVWVSASGQHLVGLTRKLQSSWSFQWTSDESCCAQLFPNEVRFFTPETIGKTAKFTLHLKGVQDFSLSPGRSPAVAAFVPALEGSPGMIRVYPLGSFQQPVAQKTFFKADKAQMVWNSLGTNILVLASTDVDVTGKSYYGETNLYYLSVAGNFDCQVILDKDGPIYDVAWNPDATTKEFAVVYGYMPAKAALFNRRATLIHDFGTGPRNYLQFNPQGRLLAVAGFGNLSGQMDIWDCKKRIKVTTINANNSTSCSWSPTGRSLMTATLSPRLRVDNGIKVWHHSGTLLYHQLIHELYQVCWRPMPVSKFPDRAGLSPPPRGIEAPSENVKRSAAPVGAYRPPHARGTPSSFSLHAKEDVSPNVSPRPAASADSPARPGASRKAARQVVGYSPVPKPKAKANGASPASITNTPAANNANSATNNASKRIRLINKKLKQIAELKERLQHGDALDSAQLAKIQSEQSLTEELQSLKQ